MQKPKSHKINDVKQHLTEGRIKDSRKETEMAFEYLDSLEDNKERFLNFTAYVTVGGNYKSNSGQKAGPYSELIDSLDKYIQKAYDDNIYYSVIPQGDHIEYSLRKILSKARISNRETAKIFICELNKIEIIPLKKRP